MCRRCGGSGALRGACALIELFGSQTPGGGQFQQGLAASERVFALIRSIDGAKVMGDTAAVLDYLDAVQAVNAGGGWRLDLARLLKPLGVRVTRIAMGIPVGSDLEYADDVTMTRAMENRRDI